MGFDRIRQVVETKIGEFTDLPIAYDNVPHDSDKGEFVRITVLDGDSFTISLGDLCVRHTGLVEIQIFTDQGEGSAKGRKHADTIAALFKGYRETDIWFEVASLTRVGHDQDFYQVNVSIPFTHDIH